MDEPPTVISADSLGAYEMPLRSPSSDDSSTAGVEVRFGGGTGSSAQSTGSKGHHHPPLQRIVRSPSARLQTGLDYDKPTNKALVFIKPHAHNEAVCKLVESTLLQKVPESRILLSCTVDGVTIGRKRLIDRHYKAIARYATEMDADKLNFEVAKFEKHFKEKWATVLAEGRACNAQKALGKLGCDPTQLEEAWRKAEGAKRTTKLGPGMYIGLVGVNDKSMYVVNGFYMAMRGKFVGADKSIKCYVLEWDERHFSWEAFRSKIIGTTDPTKAAEGSLRQVIMERYKELGLVAEPSTGENAVHASASPLEGMAERCNWLSRTPAEDDFGRALLGRGIPERKILEWMDDPAITFPPSTKDGSRKTGSVFDDVEDMDSSRCMQRLVQIYDDELFSNLDSGCACVMS